jgi:STE24 endopeptidase
VTGRRAPALTLLLLGLALAAALVVVVPWTPLPGADLAGDPLRDFTAEQLAREVAYHRALRPWGYGSLAVGLLVSVALGLTPAGARLVTAVARPFGGGWAWQVLLGTLAVTASAGWRPCRCRRGRRRCAGLRAVDPDLARLAGRGRQGVLVGAGLSALVLLALVLRARLARRTWWAWGAAATAALPSPARSPTRWWSSRCSPTSPRCRPVSCARTCWRWPSGRGPGAGGPGRRRLTTDHGAERLRQRLRQQPPHRRLRHAAADADAGGGRAGRRARARARRGAGRADRDAACRAGRRGRDLPAGAAAVLATAAAQGRRRRSPQIPRVVPLLLALAAVGMLLAAPADNLVSRRIEARADVHALDLTRDVETFVATQQRLAVPTCRTSTRIRWRTPSSPPIRVSPSGWRWPGSGSACAGARDAVP